MRQSTWAKCFGGALPLFLAGAALAWPLRAAPQSNITPLRGMQPCQSSVSGLRGIQSCVTILTPTDGVDFQSYKSRLLASVKRNWYAVMPESALMGEKGIVVLTFHIQRDGKIPDVNPTFERAANSKELDDAAVQAVQSSAPFERLPEAFHGPKIQVRFIFFYNAAVPRGRLVPLVVPPVARVWDGN
jgi:TonB family protein